MITLTRLSGTVFVLNADLIERLDATPDTVITLVDGKKYVVAESMAEIVQLIRTYRGEVIAMSGLVVGGNGQVDQSAEAGHGAQPPRPVHLAPVTPHPTTTREDD
ncbi:flagellar FlbD family protein [Nocardioides sp. GCM10027113]|uniref:flagellar FlbD family protein n=1 Tax=unclassified Nocardioides TaxID=2615069 RepID=UPI003607E385